MREYLLAGMVTAFLAGEAQNLAKAQDAPLPPGYAVSRRDLQDGMAPGMKVTELSPKSRSFRILFDKGDDVGAGLVEFARKNNLTNAHFTAIGAFDHAVIGWSDRPKKAFKVVRIDEEMEVAAFNGNITRNAEGQPVVHVHCAIGILSNAKVYAGHCLEERVSITMQLYLTDNEPLTAN